MRDAALQSRPFPVGPVRFRVAINIFPSLSLSLVKDVTSFFKNFEEKKTNFKDLFTEVVAVGGSPRWDLVNFSNKC